MTLTPSRPVSAIPILVAIRALPALITFINGLKFPSTILSPGMTYLLFTSCMPQRLTTRAKGPSENTSSFFIFSFSFIGVVTADLYFKCRHLAFLNLGRALRDRAQPVEELALEAGIHFKHRPKGAVCEPFFAFEVASGLQYAVRLGRKLWRYSHGELGRLRL